MDNHAYLFINLRYRTNLRHVIHDSYSHDTETCTYSVQVRTVCIYRYYVAYV